jgi:hypothetical protein
MAVFSAGLTGARRFPVKTSGTSFEVNLAEVAEVIGARPSGRTTTVCEAETWLNSRPPVFDCTAARDGRVRKRPPRMLGSPSSFPILPARKIANFQVPEPDLFPMFLK